MRPKLESSAKQIGNKIDYMLITSGIAKVFHTSHTHTTAANKKENKNKPNQFLDVFFLTLPRPASRSHTEIDREKIRFINSPNWLPFLLVALHNVEY